MLQQNFAGAKCNLRIWCAFVYESVELEHHQELFRYLGDKELFCYLEFSGTHAVCLKRLTHHQELFLKPTVLISKRRRRHDKLLYGVSLFTEAITEGLLSGSRIMLPCRCVLGHADVLAMT